MSNFARAYDPIAKPMLADQTFAVGWALSEEDGTAFGAPLDISAVTDVRVVAAQRVARGLTAPAATVWTLSNAGGVTLTTISSGGQTYPLVQLEATAPDPGVYDVMLILVAAGADDWLASAVFDVTAIPA